MQNQLSSYTLKVHVKAIFGLLLGDRFLQNWETGFEHQAIVCFVNQSEGDMVNMKTVCFVLY